MDIYIDPDLLNQEQRHTSRFVEEDAILEMYYASFKQGLNSAIKYSKTTHEDVSWVFSLDHHIFSFNWYCDLFNLDAEILRNLIKHKSAFGSFLVEIKEE